MISNILEQFSNQRIVDTGHGWTFGLLGLLGLIAIPIVILIYLIKSKYVPKTVSSTFIWKRSLKYMKRRIPINFIMSLLLIVQLLAVTVATFALMDVRIEDEYQNNDKIIVIDASASMTLEREAIVTTASGQRKEQMATRYQYALNRLEELTQDTGPQNGVCIIFAGDSPQLLTTSQPRIEEGDETQVPYIYDPARIQDLMGVLGEKSCSNRATDLNSALALAAEAIDTSPEAKIYLLTDRDRSGFVLNENSNIEIISCDDPENDRNLGIVGFKEKKTDISYSFDVTIDAQGRNQSYSADVIFELDGVEMDRKKVALSTNSNDAMPRTLTVTFGPIKIQEYERARVYVQTDRDIIHYDDESYLYYVAEQELKVLYVSNQLKYQENSHRVDLTKMPALMTALRSQGIAFSQENVIHADDIKKAPTSGYNLYIYEGTKPEKAPSDGAIWYFNASGAPTGVEGLLITDTVVEKPNTKIEEVVLQGDYAKEILENVNYGKEDAIIPHTLNSFSLLYSATDEAGFPIFTVPTGFDVIFTAPYEVTSEKTGATKIIPVPIMLAGTIGTTRVVVTTFELSLKNTLIHFDPDNFINLMENLTDFSTPDILPSRTPFIGEKLQFNPPSGIESIKYVYYTPAEEQIRYTDDRGAGNQEYQWSKADGEILPNVTLKKFGLYEMQVTYQPTYKVDDFGNIVQTEHKTEVYSVYTKAIDSEIKLGDTELQELIVPAKGLTEAQVYVRRTPILPWVVLVLIILLIIEWGVYYRDEY